MRKKFVFATNNSHKLEEVTAILGEKVELLSMKDIKCDTDIPETADTLEGNALLKARYIFDNYHLDCFADDTGLEVEALGRAGGYADRAHKSRVYTIYMNGSVEQLGRRSSKSIQPGCEIVVPTKPQRNKMTPQEMMTIGTSTASIATMIATLVNIH